MSLSYALPFFCDAMLYYGALGCLGLLKWCRGDVILAPVMLLVGCWLSARLTGRGRPWLRWLPTAAIIPCLIVAGNTAGRMAALPMAVYLPLYIENNRRAPDYDYAADRFRHSLIVTGVILLVAAIIGAGGWKQGLPYLFLYFTLNIALLRLLRHDDRIARSPRFRLLNLAGVALVCAAGFALSQPGILAALKTAWLWILDNVVLRAAALVLFLIQGVLFLLGRLLTWLGIGGSYDAGGFNLPQPGAAGPNLAQSSDEIKMLPAFVRYLIQGIGIALLAALVFLVLRALSRRVARTDTRVGTDVRESLDDETPRGPRAVSLRRRPEDGVRHWYRRALALARSRGGRVSPTMNTLQILEENAPPLDPEAMSALREVYLPVRYGEVSATKEDVMRAKEAYDRLKSVRERN